jgi:hypothetical protein
LLNELDDTGELLLEKKKQSKAKGYNYYIHPTLGLKLYRAKVVYVTPTYVVLEFNTFENHTLLSLLKHIHQKLQYKLQVTYNVTSDNFYPLHTEREHTFQLRCSLPHVRNKYFITCDFNGVSYPFQLPRQNATYDCLMVEIRNIWELEDLKKGYNLELKHIQTTA